MRIIDLQNTPENRAIAAAVATLKRGGLVIYPTETVYGAGVVATDATAVNRLLRFKGNRQGKAISVAVDSLEMAQDYVDLNSEARELYRTLLPGPVTVISKSRHRVSPALESPSGTLGIRLPAHDLARRLVTALKIPLTATSANASGLKPASSLADFRKYNPAASQKLVDLFLDAGALPPRLPSTVVDTTLLEPQVLRQGEIHLETPSVTTRSAAETIALAGKTLSPHLDILQKSPLLIALQGDLGAGKTQFVKGLALALGIKDTIKSPTYTLIHEYSHSKGTLYHVDTWRLESGDELLDLGLKDMLSPGNVIAIEWLQKARSLLDKLNRDYPVLWVDIQVIDLATRRIKLSLREP